MPHDDTQQNFYYINRRVGSTNYKVKVYFSSTEHETMEEKILRMVKNAIICLFDSSQFYDLWRLLL